MVEQTLKKMEKVKSPERTKEKYGEKLIRILSTDIPGNLGIYAGLTRIRGISWGLSNAICLKLNLDKAKKIGDFSENEIKEISDFMKNPELPVFLINRRSDFDEGTNKHLVTNELELRKDFDIKRLRKIKSNRGIRHAAKLPLRGQRTKSHFRKNRGKSGGIKKSK